MKKTLIAVAALAATGAFAQNVTITGTLDPMMQNQKITVGNGSDRSTTGMVATQVGTSNITFSGNEDLGGGLKAVFLYEMDMDVTQTGSSTATGAGPTQGGQIFAGLEGAFGSFKMGVPNTPTLTTQGSRSGFGTKIGGGRAGLSTGGTARTRNSDSYLYTTPNFSGFTAAVAYVPKANSTYAAGVGGTAALTEVTAITDVGVFYANGPISAGVSSYSQSNVVAQNTAFVAYTIGPVKVTGGYHTEDYKAAVAATGSTMAQAVGKLESYNVAVNYSVTPTLTLLGNVIQLNDKRAQNNDQTLVAVGVKYDLSKRTSLHLRVISEERDNVDAASTAIAKELRTTLAGIQHNF